MRAMLTDAGAAAITPSVNALECWMGECVTRTSSSLSPRASFL